MRKNGVTIGSARKRTKIKSTKKLMLSEFRGIKCSCDLPHAWVRGKAGTELQNYPKPMCRKLAKAMAGGEEVELICEICEDGDATNDEIDEEVFFAGLDEEAECIHYCRKLAYAMSLDDPSDLCGVAEDDEPDLEQAESKAMLSALRQRFDNETIRAVAKLHNMLGHPSANALANSLGKMEATRTIGSRVLDSTSVSCVCGDSARSLCELRLCPRPFTSTRLSTWTTTIACGGARDAS